MIYDVVVVGAGPAGTCAAMCLAAHGYEVALLDRATFPRDKPCGEFVNPAACQILDSVFDLSFRDLLEMGGAPVSSIKLELRKQPALEIPILEAEGHNTPGSSIPRTVFDNLLVQKCQDAGVHVYEGHSVQRLLRCDPLIIAAGKYPANDQAFTLRARLILAADGATSLCARLEGLTKPIPRLNAIGIVAHLDKVQRIAEKSSVWMFPSTGDRMMFGFTHQIENTATLSGSVPTSYARDIAQDRQGFLRKWIARYPNLQRRTLDANIVRVTTVPCFGHTLLKPFSDRILFLGDSARFVDPFTGEGIHHALESGVLAAEIAAESLANCDVHVLSKYGPARRELSARYTLCDLIQWICSKPGLVNYWGECLRQNTRLGEQLIGALADVLPARAVLRPRFISELLLTALQPVSIKRQQNIVRNDEQQSRRHVSGDSVHRSKVQRQPANSCERKIR